MKVKIFAKYNSKIYIYNQTYRYKPIYEKYMFFIKYVKLAKGIFIKNELLEKNFYNWLSWIYWF